MIESLDVGGNLQWATPVLNPFIDPGNDPNTTYNGPMGDDSTVNRTDLHKLKRSGALRFNPEPTPRDTC